MPLANAAAVMTSADTLNSSVVLIDGGGVPPPKAKPAVGEEPPAEPPAPLVLPIAPDVVHDVPPHLCFVLPVLG